jgi:hypothetical protein
MSSSSSKRSRSTKDKKTSGSSKSKGKSGGLCSRTATLLSSGLNEKVHNFSSPSQVCQSLEEVHKNLGTLKISVAGCHIPPQY